VRGTAGVPVRLKYTKRGKIRWIGHRDVARALERAFRVVQLPLAFTEGFSPHPKVSFGLALSTGYESIAEYLDLVLTHGVDLDDLVTSLGDALPEGMDVVGAVRIADRAPALQESVTAVEWRVEPARADGTAVPARELTDSVARVLASPVLVAPRRRKGREVMEDIRPVIRRLVVGGDSTSTIEMELCTQPRSAKPDDVIAVLGEYRCAWALRTCQWIERDGARLEPLDADARPRVPEVRAS
jgi:radical SAM-linked protein